MDKPWWDGLMSPAEAAELDRQGQCRLAVAEYLAKAKPKRVRITDHGPWDNQILKCLGCNRTEVELYSKPVMPECYERT